MRKINNLKSSKLNVYKNQKEFHNKLTIGKINNMMTLEDQ